MSKFKPSLIVVLTVCIGSLYISVTLLIKTARIQDCRLKDNQDRS